VYDALIIRSALEAFHFCDKNSRHRNDDAAFAANADLSAFSSREYPDPDNIVS
jgi:hypothetical protein